MKKFVLTISFLMTVAMLLAQGSITGKVVDAESGEPLIGASVLIQGTTQGTVTDFDGNFLLNNLDPKDYTLLFSYTGYVTEEVQASVGNSTSDIGTIELGFDAVGLNEVEVIASVAVDRRTPVAVSTIKGAEVEALVGNQEYPEILRKTPSIYVTKQGGGFGDSRINVRGFDQRNTAVMINGIPVNDMENGWVYWSNWAGLSDVTSQLQVQRGLGASKLAVPSVGGSINIITNAAEMEKGGSVSIGIGNDGYQKYGLVLSTGLGENGWAFSLQGTHTRGDGYVDGTKFRAYSYFASLTKVFNDKHMLSMTALGAPQWHHQRTVGSFDPITLRTYVDPDNTDEPLTDLGIRYNHLWGTLDGEEFTWRRNFYHKPKAFLNHYWTISPKTELRTSAYISFGRGGGTGPRGRINGSFDTSTKFLDENGQVRFEDIRNWNSGGTVADFGDDAKTWEEIRPDETFDNRRDYFADKYVSSNAFRQGFVRRASMNAHNWYGVLSTLETELSSRFNLVAGVDGRYYRGIHYRRMDNLLGADAYFTNTDVNLMGQFITQEKPSSAFPDLANDQKLNYWNDGLVGWLGLFSQLEYTSDKISAFLSLSGSNQGFKRIDYFNYLYGDDTTEDGNATFESDWQNFLGGTVKAGLNYRITNKHNVFVNAGTFSRQPIFDNVFPVFTNDVKEDLVNQKVYAVEGGYGFRSSWLRANLNLYYTQWTDRQFDRGIDLPNGNEGIVVFSGVGQEHVGAELDFTLRPASRLEINGMVSLANWQYNQDFEGTITDTDLNQPVSDTTLTIYADGLKVGDAAQTTFSLGASYEIVDGLRVYADYYYADNLFADYDIFDSSFLRPGAEVVKLPSYSLVDAGASYGFNLGGLRTILRVNVNNLLDEQYISELETNIVDDPTTDRNEFYDNRGWFGFGRTWNAGLKVIF